MGLSSPGAVAPLAALLAVGTVGCMSDASPKAVEKAADVSAGYVLFAPLVSTTTYLVNRSGEVVHAWEGESPPGVSVYLLDNGDLLRCTRSDDFPVFRAGGQGGRIQRLGWDGEMLWDWKLASDERLQHHDIEPLPSGNVLMIAWETKTREEAIRAGRAPDRVGSKGLWPDSVVEVEPLPPNGGRIVWEWHLWDHLIQDVDPERDNYGDVAAHPERIDINGDREPRRATREYIDRLRALGYLAAGTKPGDLSSDFVHTNSIDYNPDLDQIVLSPLGYNEIWIIDHATTTKEAAGPAGDLLYRWGNPRAYRRGTVDDQRFFGQHDARWIPPGYPGARNILVFNNGVERPRVKDYSSVVEIVPPVDTAGRYSLGESKPFGPADPVWEYAAPDKRSFFADFISGAHRLPDGNTLITSGPGGHFFEITPQGKVVWEYHNPFGGDAPNPAGDPPRSVFRATLIPADHPGLAGRTLESSQPRKSP